MTKVAVIAHAGQDVRRRAARAPPRARAAGSRRPALDARCRRAGSRRSRSKRALDDGAELLFVVGRRRNGAALRRRAAPARRPRSRSCRPARRTCSRRTCGIPQDIERAVAIGLHGERRKLDVGRFNGEHFARHGRRRLRRGDDPAGGRRRSRIASDAPPTSGPARKNLRAKPFKAKIAIDGAPWYAGEASCILVGNVGHLFGGIEVFEDARPDDGQLEIGVVNAEGVVDWIRTLARTAAGHPERSPLVQATSAKIDVKLEPQGPVRGRRRRSRRRSRPSRSSVQPEAVTDLRPQRPASRAVDRRRR